MIWRGWVALRGDLPEALRHAPAQTFHLQAKDAPVYETDHCRLRVLVGQLLGLRSPLAIPQDLLIVEGWSQVAMEIPVPAGWKVWLYDRDSERAGYTTEPMVEGHFLLVAAPL